MEQKISRGGAENVEFLGRLDEGNYSRDIPEDLIPDFAIGCPSQI